MQDFQPIPGLSGRIFTGTDAAARRIRNYPASSASSNHTQLQQQHPPAPVKCPRCDSANTKFCYYNNYNLSQPRHFCKSCRRYWTKGGVLRNVPVGGGCRKNSKPSSKPKPDKARSNPPSAPPSGSSSESSSTLTAAPNTNPSSEANPEPILDQPIFAETAGSSTFAGLMGGGAEAFNFADPGVLPGFLVSADPEPERRQTVEEEQQQQQAGDTTNMQEKGGGLLNGLDWGAGGSMVDSGSLFDITSSVDPAVYWNQSHWADTDPSLYLP